MKSSINFKNFLSMLWGDVAQTPEEEIYEKKVQERKKHLKPCPLCGCTEPIIQETEIAHTGKVCYVACPNCTITSTKKGGTIVEAMDIWDSLGDSKK